MLKSIALPAIAFVALAANAAQATDTLPTTTDECPLSQVEFNSWFQSGVAAPNGIVKPANSISFAPTSNCSFYKWAEQMWLWATSPAPAGYGGSGRVFTSNVFYDVSAPDPNNNFTRNLIAHSSPFNPIFAASLARADRNHFTFGQDVNGGFHEIVEAPRMKTGNSMIRNDAGRLVEIGRIVGDKEKPAVFYDTSGKRIDATVRLTFDLLPPTITGPLDAYVLSQRKVHATDIKAIAASVRQDAMRRLADAPIVERFVVGRMVTFVNTTNSVVVPMEVTQAGGNDVLITQGNQVTYYGIHVNDVYAYYLTGRKTTNPVNQILPAYTPSTPGNFPTSQNDFNAIQTAFPNKSFPDSVALAIELKTSWVPASSLPDPQDYILRSVRVPVYNQTSSNLIWTPTGTQVVQLAMVAMHVVGSVAGHREMVWATYEHVNNSPHGRYNFSFPTATVSHLEPLNNGPNSPPWLYYDNTGSQTCPATTTNMPTICNIAQSQLDSSGNIVNIANSTNVPITPSEVMRIMAFGSAVDQQPDPCCSPTKSNDQIISMNNHVRVLTGDVRNNYVFTGATWTSNGLGATGQFGSPNGGNEIGTNMLSDSTLETFQQGQSATVSSTSPVPNTAPVKNCLECHGSNTTDVSHIFWNTNPLP